MNLQLPSVPARALNEWVYCNRLGILEWVQAEFAPNHYTKDGDFVHRRQDKPTQPLPQPDELIEGQKTRSVYLEAKKLGLVARMDLVESKGGEVIPVDTKRGALPSTETEPSGTWAPDRIQLGAQALILKEHGYQVTKGYIFYASSKRRVEVLFDDALLQEVREALQAFRNAAAQDILPPPLINSPKCHGCSLAPICLPDEVLFLQALGTEQSQPTKESLSPPRRLYARRDESKPLYVTESRYRVGASKGKFTIKDGSKLVGEVPIRNTSQIAVFGRTQVSTMALREAMDANIPVLYFTFGGYFLGLAHGHPHKNIVLRKAQFCTADSQERSLEIAKKIVASKIKNQRTLLRRNAKPTSKYALQELQILLEQAAEATGIDTLLGMEGQAAKIYFAHFNSMLRPQENDALTFDFTTRNRRPPRDPINALLSYLYSLLTRECFATLLAVGFDPYMGFYHQPRYGKPALALDLMEEFRPLIADSILLRLVNQNELTSASFISRSDGCNLTSTARRVVLNGYERRLREEITHPIFGYQVSWRRVIEVQARLLSRHLLGELPVYQPIETR